MCVYTEPLDYSRVTSISRRMIKTNDANANADSMCALIFVQPAHQRRQFRFCTYSAQIDHYLGRIKNMALPTCWLEPDNHHPSSANILANAFSLLSAIQCVSRRCHSHYNRKPQGYHTHNAWQWLSMLRALHSPTKTYSFNHKIAIPFIFFNFYCSAFSSTSKSHWERFSSPHFLRAFLSTSSY